MFHYIVRYIIIEIIFLFPALALYIFIFNVLKNKTRSTSDISSFFLFNNIPIYALKVILYALLVVAIMWVSIVFRIRWKLLTYLFIGLFNVLSFIYLVYKFIKKQTDRKAVNRFFKVAFKLLIIELFVFSILTLLRGLSPELATTEKPMDYSFIANFLHQDLLPFKNPWLFGFLLNYYYLGQLFVSMLTYIISLPPWISYNFAISLISTWAFMVLFEFFGMICLLYRTSLLTRNKIKNGLLIFIILLGTSIILFGGNFYYLARVLADNINLLVGKKVLNFTSFFYPDSTRVIPYTINEYPAYSILLGDLHGHFIALPFIYAFISLFVFSFYYIQILTKLSQAKFIKSNQLVRSILIQKVLKLLPIIFLLASDAIFIVSTNSWDAINLLTFVFLFLILFWYQQYIDKNRIATSSFVFLLIEYFIIALVGLIGILPFLKYFLPPTDGVGLKVHFDFKYYLPLFGHYILLLFIIWFIVNQSRIKINKLLRILFPFLALLLSGIFLILATQFLYIKDIFYKTNMPYYRANTVFKIYYTSWSFIGISLVSLFILLLVNYEIPNKVKKFALQFYILLGSLLISYFIVGSVQRFRLLDVIYVKRRLKSIFSFHYLDGIFSTYYFDNLQSKFVKNMFYRNLKSIIIEPIDYKSYSDTAKFCIYSGQFCFLGWPMHNMQWYGGFNGVGISWNMNGKYFRTNVAIQRRVRLIQSLYKNTDLSLLHAYPNMKSFHIFVYKKLPIVINPDITANRILTKLSNKEEFTCSMTLISKVYDIYCKKSE